jgi:NADH:ubiquinone oxidoreductase subunit 6 (subunit J)
MLPTRLSSEQLAIGVLFAAVTVLACLAPAQSDTWWLLREGGEILRRGSVSLVDEYSHTAAGLFWPNHEWLTEVVLFMTHRVAGMPGVAALAAALIVSTWAASWRLTPGSFEVRFLLFAGAIALSASGWAIRPQIFSMALFLLTVHLCVNRHEIWLPLVFVAWANLHGAVALGLVVVAASVAARTWTDRRIHWRLVAIGAACGLATLISPLGWRLWTFIPASMERSRINQLIEWLPPDLTPLYLPFWAMAAALVALAVVQARKLDARTTELTVTALAVVPLAIQARRNVPVFLLVGVPALASLIASRWPPATRRRQPQENERLNGFLVWTVGLLSVAGVALAWAAPARRLGWEPISASAVTAIRACPGPLYNTYGDGGVLIWFVPERPVFIDNRQDPYPPEVLAQNRALEMGGPYEGLFAQHDISCAAVPTSSLVAQRLRQDGSWTSIHTDTQWAIFAKR